MGAALITSTPSGNRGLFVRQSLGHLSSFSTLKGFGLVEFISFTLITLISLLGGGSFDVSGGGGVESSGSGSIFGKARSTLYHFLSE